MKVFRTSRGIVAQDGGGHRLLPGFDWNWLFQETNVVGLLHQLLERAGRPIAFDTADLLAPIVTQEVWAAGVTYTRSRTARVEESKSAGGASFYDRVYEAPRPELFFKATPARTVGHGRKVGIRGDSKWSVPEPELALAINTAGRVFGYTIGNDMSARDIEGENPLYLPQAKIYDACCALGPGLLIGDSLDPSTLISLAIFRQAKTVFEGTTSLGAMKRSPEELADYLFRHNNFPAGCFLLTGTGIVPPNDFSLREDDEIQITIEPIGTLVNRVRVL